MENIKPKFSKGDEVVYGEGNWKYIVHCVVFSHGEDDEDGEYDGPKEIKYVLICNDDVCGCPGDMNVMSEKDLLSYDEWCDKVDKEDNS
jgi:hypothetical protein